LSPELEVQYASNAEHLPAQAALRRWAEAALRHAGVDGELLVRIVDEAESSELNLGYRGKQGPTNVLSFPFDAPPALADERHLGDIVICAPVVRAEASQQGKVLSAHWGHMVVHGVLHLLGYDHQTTSEAHAMERLECEILAELGFPNPYET